MQQDRKLIFVHLMHAALILYLINSLESTYPMVIYEVQRKERGGVGLRSKG